MPPLRCLRTSAHSRRVDPSTGWRVNIHIKQPSAPQGGAEDRPANNLLRALRPVDFDLLKPQFQMWSAEANTLLYRPGDHVGMVYFPCGPSLVSFLVSNEDGHDVETVLVGREGAVGGVVSRGHLPAYTKVIVQFGGPFVRVKIDDIEAAKEKSQPLNQLFARYADCLLAQIFQSTACNAIHSIEQRAAKWILSALDRTGNHVVPLTQEQLASMLGVGRSYVSRIIRTFKNDGLLRTGRGALHVIDHETLRARACACDESVKSHFDMVLSGVYPHAGPADPPA